MITNELLLTKIKEQLNEAERVQLDPLKFIEVIKRVEVLCELVTESTNIDKDLVERDLAKMTKVTPKEIKSTDDNDSIFDF